MYLIWLLLIGGYWVAMLTKALHAICCIKLKTLKVRSLRQSIYLKLTKLLCLHLGKIDFYIICRKTDPLRPYIICKKICIVEKKLKMSVFLTCMLQSIIILIFLFILMRSY